MSVLFIVGEELFEIKLCNREVFIFIFIYYYFFLWMLMRKVCALLRLW